MIDVQYELEQLHENPEWLTVLETYDRLIASSKKADPEAEGWMNRLREFEGVEPEDLSHIHGSLIAHGFLRFQIADRTSGMEYRLSQLGKQALTRQFVPEQDEELPRDDELLQRADDVDDDSVESDYEVEFESDVEYSKDQADDAAVTEVFQTSDVDEVVEDGTDTEASQQMETDEVVASAIASDAEVIEGSSTIECPNPAELLQLDIGQSRPVMIDQPQPRLVDQPQPRPVETPESVLEFPLPIIDLDELKKSA